MAHTNASPILYNNVFYKNILGEWKSILCREKTCELQVILFVTFPYSKIHIPSLVTSAVVGMVALKDWKRYLRLKLVIIKNTKSFWWSRTSLKSVCQTAFYSEILEILHSICVCKRQAMNKNNLQKITTNQHCLHPTM